MTVDFDQFGAYANKSGIGPFFISWQFEKCPGMHLQDEVVLFILRDMKTGRFESSLKNGHRFILNF